MTAALISKGFTQFYTTELHLKTPDFWNDWANYSLSYVQYFVGKEAIQCQDGKLERIDPKKVEEKFPWIPSAIKSTAYFFLAIPFVVLGTAARALSFDSKQIADAIFADRACLPPRKELKRPAKRNHIRPQPRPALTPKTDAKRSEEAQASASPKAATSSSAPNVDDKVKKFVLNSLQKVGDGPNAAAASQTIQGMKPEDVKSMLETEMSRMLGMLLSFDEELLRHAKNLNAPDYAAVAVFIEAKKKENYQAPFFLRDYFMMSLSQVQLLGVKFNAQDIARWEELDAQCQVLMNTPELKTYLDEPPPASMQGIISASLPTLKSQALELKAMAQDIMRKHSKFFNQLLELLKTNPMDRSAVLTLLNEKAEELPRGAEAFTFACVYKAQTRLLNNFYDEPLFSRFIDLYTSCFLQLHTAKFTIPTQFNILCRDLVEQPRPTATAPSSAAPSAEPANLSVLQRQASVVSALLQYVVSFSEELLQYKSVDAKKAFIESKRKDTANYKAPFFTRVYLIYTWGTLIETGVSLNLYDFNRWKALDTQLEIAMQNTDLKSFLDEEVPYQLKQAKSEILKNIRTSILQDKAKHEKIIQLDTRFFEALLSQLAKTPLDRKEIDETFYGPEKAKASDVFFYGKWYLAVREGAKDLFNGKMYENYFNAYLACITQLQALNFEIPFLPMSSPQAKPKPAAAVPSAPALSSGQVTRINQELKTITDFFEELLEITPSGTAEWLNAQKSKTEAEYCYPFHWSKTNAKTLETHRNRFDQALMKKWEKLHPKCITRLEDNKLQAYLDETPESPADCKQS